MSGSGNIQEILGELLKTSRHVHSLAQAGNWDDFVEAEQTRQSVVARLQELLKSPGHNPTASEKAQFNSIIVEILELDKEIQSLVEKQMAGIAESLHSLGISKRLNDTYLRP